MLKKFGSTAMVVAVGMLVGGVVGTGCDMGEGEACVVDEDCTKAGETCIADIFSSVCGCDPTAVVDSCTEADVNNVCHPDRKICELSCLTDKDCTSGETCDQVTNACRAEGAKDDCTKPGNACVSGEVCDTASKACVAKCTEMSCTGTQVCNAVSGLCENDANNCGGLTCSTGQYCDDANNCRDECGNDLDCELDEECNTTTSRCVEKSGCTTNADCAEDGGFCNTSGDCETRLDISECSTSVRQYVKYELNQCVATKGNLDTCDAAAKRSSSRPETANGPTLFAGESIARTASVAHCTNAPEVQFFVDYYSAKKSVATAAGASGLYGDLYQSAATNENTSNTIIRCGTDKTDGVCAGITSDATSGRILFSLCRPASITDETVAVYLGDKNDPSAFGNTLCIDIKPAHL